MFLTMIFQDRKYKLINHTNDLYDLYSTRNLLHCRKGKLGGQVDSPLVLSHEDDCWIDNYCSAIRSTVTGDTHIMNHSKINNSSITGKSTISKCDICNSGVSNSSITAGNVTDSTINKSMIEVTTIGNRSDIDGCTIVESSIHGSSLWESKVYNSSINNVDIPISCHIKDAMIKKEDDIFWELHDTKDSSISIILYRSDSGGDYIICYCYMHNQDPMELPKDRIWHFFDTCEEADLALRQEVPIDYQPIYSSMIRKLYAAYVNAGHDYAIFSQKSDDNDDDED